MARAGSFVKALKKIWYYSRDALAVALLLVVYHGYELWCYLMGNMFSYYLAVAICAGTLFLVSVGLIYLHDYFKSQFAWDALRLQYLNELAGEEEIPPYQIFRRMTRFVLRKGFWAIFVIGPVMLGPFIITVLLRRHKTWKYNLLYASCGALFSALFWVAVMRGIGMITWKLISN